MTKKEKTRVDRRRRKGKPAPGSNVPKILLGPLLPDEERWREAILNLVDAHWGSISGALKEAGIHRRGFYAMMEKNEEFKKRLYEFRETCIDRCEDLIIERATVGEDRPLYYMGRLVGYQKTPDNQLLLALIRSRKREYRPSSLEVGAMIGKEGIKFVVRYEDGQRDLPELAKEERKTVPAFLEDKNEMADA